MSSLITHPGAPISPGDTQGIAPGKALEVALQQTLPMARLQHQEVPHCDGLTLALINSDFPTGPLPPEVMRDVVANPAYWAFCWGSGQALARHLLEQPEIVANRRVLDLGSGSGVAGIAAAMAGAAQVCACDTDLDAKLATRYNAQINGICIEQVDDFTAVPGFDVVLMADVLYDKNNLPLLKTAQQVSTTVWVADSRIANLDEPGFDPDTRIDAYTLPNLGEFDEFGTTQIWRGTGSRVDRNTSSDTRGST